MTAANYSHDLLVGGLLNRNLIQALRWQNRLWWHYNNFGPVPTGANYNLTQHKAFQVRSCPAATGDLGMTICDIAFMFFITWKRLTSSAELPDSRLLKPVHQILNAAQRCGSTMFKSRFVCFFSEHKTFKSKCAAVKIMYIIKQYNLRCLCWTTSFYGVTGRRCAPYQDNKSEGIINSLYSF